MSASASVRMFRGEQLVQQIDPLDRGLAYGDGLFETLRVHRGEVPWWPAHWARLQRGAERLRLPLPDQALAHAQASALIADEHAAVLKLLVTRGIGGRGYAPPDDVEPMWVLSRHPLPQSPATGVRLRWCETSLGHQPILAGIKHCNRLEQVLARAECVQEAVDEGLMCDQEGFVTCATAANLFILRDRVWQTPLIDRCGVAGVMRQWLLNNVAGIETRRLTRADVECADALFLCNAVRGILPVVALAETRWSHSPAVESLQQRLAEAVPMFTISHQE